MWLIGRFLPPMGQKHRPEAERGLSVTGVPCSRARWKPNFLVPNDFILSEYYKIVLNIECDIQNVELIIMKSLVQSRLLIIGLAVAVSNIAVANAQCYYPGGTWAKDQFPCNGHAYTTLCCPTGWTCFSNNLCIATDPSVVSSDLPLGTSIRGTCTNPLWNSTACGDFCLSKFSWESYRKEL
jgi:hypothetical protein